MKIISYSDAAFANVEQCYSQGGHIVFLSSNAGVHAPIAWQSRKLKRVVKSTLSAETMALLESIEHCCLIKATLLEILGSSTKIPILCYVDSKSLHDSVHSSKTLEDKRAKIDVCAVRSYIANEEITDVSWVPTDEQLADSLTKSGASSIKLMQVLQQSQ